MASLAAHAAALAAAWWVGSRPAPARPPVYRVELVGAPAGVRQAGIVGPPDPAPPAAAPELGGAERVPPPPAAPAKPPKPKERPAPRATPSPVRTRNAGRPKDAAATGTALPKARAGATGGKGADVANVRTDGIAFPFPGYLANIVRQLARNWSPRRTSAVLVAEVRFLIHRDGSVSDIEVVRPSGDRLYDLDAAGAVESVGAARGFGRLPAGWQDDVLVVYFTFDYALRPQ
ncbi:MAG: TonB C-terminal domain-containing protein [Gemmatimonadetes bacterium]|nr:TonB C-terminal domain-containing protein [Gemmatimonadota bacterium]